MFESQEYNNPNNYNKEPKEEKRQNAENQIQLDKLNISKNVYLAFRSEEKVEKIYGEFSSLLNEEKFNEAIIKISELVKNDTEFRNTPYYIVPLAISYENASDFQTGIMHLEYVLKSVEKNEKLINQSRNNEGLFNIENEGSFSKFICSLYIVYLAKQAQIKNEEATYAKDVSFYEEKEREYSEYLTTIPRAKFKKLPKFEQKHIIPIDADLISCMSLSVSNYIKWAEKNDIKNCNIGHISKEAMRIIDRLDERLVNDLDIIVLKNELNDMMAYDNFYKLSSICERVRNGGKLSEYIQLISVSDEIYKGMKLQRVRKALHREGYMMAIETLYSSNNKSEIINAVYAINRYILCYHQGDNTVKRIFDGVDELLSKERNIKFLGMDINNLSENDDFAIQKLHEPDRAVLYDYLDLKAQYINKNPDDRKFRENNKNLAKSLGMLVSEVDAYQKSIYEIVSSIMLETDMKTSSEEFFGTSAHIDNIKNLKKDLVEFFDAILKVRMPESKKIELLGQEIEFRLEMFNKKNYLEDKYTDEKRIKEKFDEIFSYYKETNIGIINREYLNRLIMYAGFLSRIDDVDNFNSCFAKIDDMIKRNNFEETEANLRVLIVKDLLLRGEHEDNKHILNKIQNLIDKLARKMGGLLVRTDYDSVIED